MKRGGYLKRRTPVNPRNAKRRAARYARNFGERADAVRAMPCLVPGCPSPSQAAHARARGMGGVKGDRRDLVPLCAAHHHESSEHRTSKRRDFEERHGVDLMAIAAAIAIDLDQRGYE